MGFQFSTLKQISVLRQGNCSLSSSHVNLYQVGKGEHYCVPCARYFMNPGDLVRHEASKPHKKRLKLLKEPQYNHAEADRAGWLLFLKISLAVEPSSGTVKRMESLRF